MLCLLFFCVAVCGLKQNTYNRSIYNRSGYIIHQEFRHGSWIGDGTRTSLWLVCWQSLWQSFVILFFFFFSLCLCLLPFLCILFVWLCSCQRAFPMTLMSCPVQSRWIVLSLLVEQSSYRSLQQICSYNTKQRPLCNNPRPGGGSLCFLLHTLVLSLISFLLLFLTFFAKSAFIYTITRSRWQPFPPPGGEFPLAGQLRAVETLCFSSDE